MQDPILSTVVGKITDAIGQRVELFLGAADELKKLSSTFQSIRAFLNDAETKQVADESVRIWLSRLKHVAYDTDDLLDRQLILSLENEASGGDNGSIGNKVLARFRGCGPRGQLAGRIKEIRERLDQIAEDKENYSFVNMGTGSRTVGDWARAGGSRLPTCSLVESSEVIGRDSDKEILINQLVSGGSSRSSSHEEDGQVRAVAVVGIGGLGKTTLAQGICNDSRVETHFGKILWVCVTENFDLVRVMKAILGELGENAPFPDELSTLQKLLHGKLKENRFLLVLDDMWDEDEEKWNPVRLSLRSGAPGSRILVTTRIEKVATAMNAVCIYKLKGLSADDCWKLFSSKALAERKEEDRCKLEGIGKEIVKKCKGVPLSVKVMGSAMRSKVTVDDWQNILDSKIWSLPEAKNKILPALFLSYSNLPAHLKQCFAYCSIYRKDEVMVKGELVKLWMAQGLIQSQGNREIEDIGAEHFEDLVELSMFHEVERREKTSCKMHDLFHDLARFITEDETSIFTEGKSDPCSTNVRHASLFFTDDSIPVALFRASTLRTLFLNGNVQRIDDITLVNLFCQLSFLRVLRMSGSEIGMLTETIGKLKHLRYLDLSNSDIVELPESVTHLQVLHTLNLNFCWQLQRLPSGMERMVSLRHLEIEYTDSLAFLPKGFGRLTSLRCLSKFIVGGEGECGIDELHGLNSLQGRLQIEHLERVSSSYEAGTAELWNKPHLRTLNLSLSSGDADIERMGDVLEGLRPHRNLEELIVSCFRASKLPVWMEDSSFSNLTRVIIKSLSHCAQLPGLGNLPALEYISMEYVCVRKLGREVYFGNSGGRREAGTTPVDRNVQTAGVGGVASRT